VRISIKVFAQLMAFAVFKSVLAAKLQSANHPLHAAEQPEMLLTGPFCVLIKSFAPLEPLDFWSKSTRSTLFASRRFA